MKFSKLIIEYIVILKVPLITLYSRTVEHLGNIVIYLVDNLLSVWVKESYLWIVLFLTHYEFIL